MTAVLRSLPIALSVLALSIPGSALSSTDGSPAPQASGVVAPSTSTSSPLLEALAYEPARRDSLDISFEFTDWAALKALHGGADVNSASPLKERQRLMLDIVRSEVTATSPGLDRLAIWPERWGWDTTDLVWQATMASGDIRVLRFREDRDPGPFVARLEAYGYSRDEKPHGIVFAPGPGTKPPGDAYLERMFGLQPQVGERAFEPGVSVAISADGRTVVLVRFGGAHWVLRWAARAEPAAVQESPFGRVAAALGRPLAASIVDGRYACSGTGEEDIDLTDDAADLVRSVSTLRPYQAYGIGYERAGPGEPALGRYVFAYEEAQQAEADLPGRRTLIDEGYSLRHGKPYRDAAFTLVDAVADGREIVLGVAPLNDLPGVLWDLQMGRSMSFAMCG